MHLCHHAMSLMACKHVLIRQNVSIHVLGLLCLCAQNLMSLLQLGLFVSVCKSSFMTQHTQGHVNIVL